MLIGLDASNLSSGGGITHLRHLLAAARPDRDGFDRILVWSSRKTLAQLPDRPWLEPVNYPVLDSSLRNRARWQQTALPRIASRLGCDLLFEPGGTVPLLGGGPPTVTMSRNMLPFQLRELLRYGASRATARFLVLRAVQSLSFQRADAVIFLTAHARERLGHLVGRGGGRSATIPHGVEERFRLAPRPQRPLAPAGETPMRLLYVSSVDPYKHQWHVVDGVARLRREGLPVALDLVGPSSPRSLGRLEAAVARVDPGGEWVTYRGAVPHAELHRVYHAADVFIFASSCENMPNTLLEGMAAGLPIACSDRPPMPEILGGAGLLFDPENPGSIADALRRLLASPELRAQLAQQAFDRAAQFSWDRCAAETFSFLRSVADARR